MIVGSEYGLKPYIDGLTPVLLNLLETQATSHRHDRVHQASGLHWVLYSIQIHVYESSSLSTLIPKWVEEPSSHPLFQGGH